MNAIAASSNSSATRALPTPPAAASTDSSSGQDGGDLLAAMNPAMDAAFAVGRPTDARGAAAILATTGAYIAGANATIDKLSDGIDRREKELAQLRISDPEAASDKEAALEMLKKLRDRIQLSIERVSKSAAGDTSGDDDAAGDDLAIETSTARSAYERDRLRREQAELLEQRRLLLAPSTIVAPTDSSMVAGTYAATAARTS